MKYFSEVDGHVFDTEQECLEHEKLIRKKTEEERIKKERYEEIQNKHEELEELRKSYEKDYGIRISFFDTTNTLMGFWENYIEAIK